VFLAYGVDVMGSGLIAGCVRSRRGVETVLDAAGAGVLPDTVAIHPGEVTVAVRPVGRVHRRASPVGRSLDVLVEPDRPPRDIGHR
jgi:hypothetical protein